MSSVNCPHFKTSPGVINLWLVLAMALLLISLDCGLLGSELSELSTFSNIVMPYSFVVCFGHGVLLN